MSKRHAAVVTLTVLALLVAAALAHRDVKGRRLRRDRIAFDAIRTGMTVEEVSAVVGAPPCEWPGPENADYHSLERLHRDADDGPNSQREIWDSGQRVLIVWFD